MAETLPNGIRKLDNEGPLRQEVIQTGANATVQWGRLIACLPQLDSVDLIHPTLKLGRCDECDIVIHKSKFLPDQLLLVSKEHFLIARNPEDDYIAFITDLSKNGTYVNGEAIGRMKTIILQNNDSIAIGEKLQVYIFKSMTHSVPEDYLPRVLRKKYAPSSMLGVGACGEVRLAYHKFTCKKYAVKKIVKGRDTPSQLQNINHPLRILIEIDIMRSITHPFIIGMQEIVQTPNEVILVLEYADGGELTKKIMSENPMTESDVKFLFFQMALAVKYLHSKGITHRDLKPANVLLTTKGSLPVIKIVDFGLSKISDGYDMMKTVCGTWHYIAPEIINPETRYTSQVDVWSLGVMLFYMLSRELPFQAMDKSTLGKLITSRTYNMRSPAWYEVSSAAKDLIKQMLYVNPRKRISVSGILNHRWIDKDHLMQYRVDNLVTSLHYTSLFTQRSSTGVDKAITRGIKRIRLASDSGEPCV